MARLTPEQMQDLMGTAPIAQNPSTGKISPEEMQALMSPSKAVVPGGAPQAALEGFGQTASMGYLPQMQAAVGTGIQQLLNPNDPETFKEMYLRERDANIQRQEEQATQHPIASVIGKGAGIGATMALPFGAAGKSLASAAKTGAAMGAAYNPGDEAGVIDPLQIKERAINAAVGGASGAAIQAPLNIISKAARRSKLVGAMKKPTQFADDMTEEGRQIISKAKKKFVAPEAAKLKEAIKGSTYEINPSRIRGISKGLDAVADRLEKRAGDSGRATMSANRTLRLKRILQRHSKFSQTEALAMPSKTITAKKANQARKILEKQINQNPKAANINKSLNKALSNIDRFGKKVESDSIGAFKAGVGTTKRGRYADVAEKAGVDYAEKADDLNAALKASKLSPEGFLHPLEFIKTGYGYAKRGAGAVARPIDAIASPLRTPKAQQSIQRALAEKRRK